MARCSLLLTTATDAVTLDKLQGSLRRGPYVGASPSGMELEAA